MPPLRELAPQPNVSASSTPHAQPRFPSVRAAERPQKPPPITATSRESGSSGASNVGEATVVASNFLYEWASAELAEEILALTAAGKTIALIRASRKKRDDINMGSLPSRCVLFFFGGNSRCLFLVAVEAVDGMMVPKRPSCSPLMPAVKNRWWLVQPRF